MTREELVSTLIDQYSLLQEIKQANGNQENPVLEYKLKVIVAKLSSFGVNVEDITLKN